MPLIGNFAETPLERPTPEPGLYSFAINDEPTMQPSKKNKSVNVIVFDCEIIDDGEFQGTRIKQFVSVKADVTIKRLATACGIEPELHDQLSTDMFMGTTFQAYVKVTETLDEQTGSARKYANIDQIYVEGENDLADAGEAPKLGSDES